MQRAQQHHHDQEHPVKVILRSPDLRAVMPGLATSSLMSNLFALALPLAMLQIFDRVLANNSLETLTLITFGVIVAIILEQVLRVINGQVTSWLGARWEQKTTLAALDRLLHVSLQRYFKQEPSAYTDRISSASKISHFYSGQALMVLFDLPFVALFLTLTALIGGWMVVAPIVLLILFTYITIQFAEWIRVKVHERHITDDRRFNFLVEVLSGIHSVKSLSLEPQMQRRHERLMEGGVESGEALARGNAVAAGLGNLFTQVMVVTVVFVGAWLVIIGDMTPGALAASMMLSVRALQPLRQALSVWIRYQTFVESNTLLNEILETPSEITGKEIELSRMNASLSLQQVTYSPKHGDALFSDLSFELKAGEVVAIQGDSGSGKTSLMNLLNGLIKPTSGRVLIDGVPITHYTPDSVLRQIALLPQVSSTFAGTILENLTMFDDSKNEKALELAKELGLNRAVANMALGYETPMGEGLSETLPSGVRQVITIIRALVNEPSVILFDEANIGLDFAADRLLKDYLQQRKGSVSIVLITPRPSLLSLADRSYVLQGGRLLSPEEALAENQKPVVSLPMQDRPAHDTDLSHLIAGVLNINNPLSACLLPLLDALKWAHNGRALAEAMPHIKPNIGITDFNSIMVNLGYMPSHISSDISTLHDKLMPCLFIPANGQHALVILEKNQRQLRVFDPLTGKEGWISTKEKLGEVYFFKLIDRDEKKLKSRTTNWFVELFWRFRYHMMLTLFLTFVATTLALASPFFVRTVYDTVIPSSDLQFGAFLLFGALMAVILEWVVQLLKSRITAYLGGRSEYILGNSMFSRIITLPINNIEGASVDRQVARIRSLDGLREFFLGPLSLLMFELPATIILFAALAILNPWSILVVLIAILTFLLLAVSTRKLSEMTVANTSRNTALRWEYLNEVLTHMQALRMAGARQEVLTRFKERSSKAVMSNYQDNKLHARINTIASTLGMLTGLAVLVLSAYLVLQGDITAGSLMATQMIIWRLISPIQNAFTSATSLVRMQSTIRQVSQLMKLQTEDEIGVKQSLRPSMIGAISFNRVSFRFVNDADPAILGVTFNVEPRQMVVISGGNGSGKSTILKMIIRLYSPQAGTVRLDNIDSRQMTIKDLRSRVSYMPSSCQIFYGTIAQNLRLIHPSASNEELAWATSMAGLSDDIAALPEGMNTRIANARAGQLPNGFLQRLSLARTMLRPAPIILMDEPGSGMDKAGEDALMHCLQWLKGKSTVVVVSLRPAHMRLADNVIYMQEGSILKMGTYDEISNILMAGAR